MVVLLHYTFDTGAEDPGTRVPFHLMMLAMLIVIILFETKMQARLVVCCVVRFPNHAMQVGRGT